MNTTELPWWHLPLEVEAFKKVCHYVMIVPKTSISMIFL